MTEGPPPTWQRGKLPQHPKTKNHPFCAPLQALEMALGWKGEERTITLRLPTTRTGPRPSPSLIHAWELDEDTPPFLAPWLVSGLWLSPADAWHRLLELPNLGETRENGRVPFTLGDDARFWHHTATLALETLAAQKLVPVLAPTGPDTFHARWLPVLDNPKDGPRLARLEAAMPPLCRAHLTPGPSPTRRGGRGVWSPPAPSSPPSSTPPATPSPAAGDGLTRRASPVPKPTP